MQYARRLTTAKGIVGFSWKGSQQTLTDTTKAATAYSHRRFPMKHQGPITSDIISMVIVMLAPLMPIEINPVHRDRLRIAVEECPGQPHFEATILEWDRLSQLAVAADHANRHPEWALGV